MATLPQNRSLGFLAAIVGIAVTTGMCALLRSRINEMTVALAMLLVVLFVAVVWERWPGMLASVLGMLCLNYFFLPPLYTFTIADPKNWIALSAFFITALTAGQVSTWAKQRAAEAEASRSQARLASAYNRGLLEASLDPLLTVGSDGKISDVNAAAETVTGYSRTELIGTDFPKYFREPEKARAAFDQVFRGDVVRGYAMELRHRGGHSTSVVLDGSLYRDVDGNVIGVVASARPIGTYAGKPVSARPNPMVVRHLRLFVGFASLYSVVVGLLSLFGLTFRIAVLKSIIQGHPVVKINAAVCLVLLGFSLWLLRKDDQQPFRKTRRLCGLSMGAITAFVGLLSLTEHMTGWDLRIDQLLFREPVADSFFSVRPGLIAPITALDFVLLGLALLLLDRGISWKSRRYWPGEYFASLTAILSIFGLLDFILGSHTSYTHIALQTAIALLLLSLASLCARTERGLAALLASSTTGGALVRRLLPAAVIIPIVIGALGWRALSAGLYSGWSVVSLMTIAMITLLAGLAIANGYIVNRSDVERRRAEGVLHRRQMELREAERLARMGSWWWDPKTDRVTWSAGLSHITKREPMLPPPGYKEHIGFYTSQSSARLDAAIQGAIKTGVPYELDLEMVRTDGAIRSVSGRGEVERNADGQVVLVRGTVQDDTELKQAENETRVLARLQAVVAELGQLALRSDQPGKVLDEAVALVAQNLNVDYCKVLELLPDKKVLLLRSGVGWEEGLVGRATVGAGKESQAGYTLLFDRPVIVRDLRTETRFSGSPLLHEHGVVSGISTIITTSEGPYGVLGAHTKEHREFSRDEVNFLQSVANVLGTMIERQHADDALRESEANLNRAQKIAHIGSWHLDPVHDRLTWSDEVFRIFGVPKVTNLTYEAFVDAVYPEDRDAVNKAWSAALHGSRYDIEHRITVDGKVKWVRERAKVEFDKEGTAIEGLGTVQDITERKRAESEIRALNAELEQRVVARTAQLQSANRELEQAREREIETGFRIQQTLLLDPPPVDVPGLRVAALTIPSQRIDGDFYIFLRHSDESLDVIVGDVMGKGIPAALLGGGD
jgi:PAS domain S-box-containing protein